MAKKTDLGIQVFTNKFLGKEYSKEDYDGAIKQIRELAANPNPVNRYEIAQIVAYTVDNVLGEKLNYLENIADVKRVGTDEKAQFRIKLEGIKAFIQAKGSTTERSKIAHKYVTLDTDEVSARPVINYQKLRNGQQDMEEVISDAIQAMEDTIVQRIETVAYDAFSTLSSPNYVSGAGIVADSLNPLIVAMSRFGKPAIFGDVEIISKLTENTGFNSAVADQIAIEHNQNGYIGTYKGASVNRLANRYTDDNLTSLILRKDLLYIVPAGSDDLRPLKVVFEGDMYAMESTQIDDRSWEILLAKNFGAGIVAAKKLMAVYEDTSL